MTLETERLILRPFVESDFEAVHSYASNYDNIKYMVFGPNSEDDTRDFIKECIERAKKSPQTQFDFAVTLKDSGKVIGGCGIYSNQAGDEGMLGWILHMDYWKQGYGSEFAAELIRFGFTELNLHRIYATCFAENYGSYRVMERNNMRREAYFIKCRKGRKCDPEPWYDELHYAILKEEWEKNGDNNDKESNR